MAKLQEKYSYGNDIELMIRNRKTNKYVSAITVLKRDKHDPIDLGDGIKLYHDNILAEVSFPPYYSKEEMFNRFQTVFSRIQKYIGKNYEIVPKASHVFADSELQDPKALESGCSANFDAYTVTINPPTQFNGGLRSAGYHNHVGGKHLTDFQTRLNTVKLMDILVGVPAVIYDKDRTAKARRKIYGHPSEHRPTPFGLEYRPLSPGVLNSRETTELTFDLINHTLEQVEQGKAEEILNSIDPELVKKAIRECNKKLALKVLEKVKIPNELMERIKKNYKGNFYKSWGIKRK